MRVNQTWQDSFVRQVNPFGITRNLQVRADSDNRSGIKQNDLFGFLGSRVWVNECSCRNRNDLSADSAVCWKQQTKQNYRSISEICESHRSVS